MKVIVKKLQGKECVVDILPSETVLELKHKVSDLLGIDVPQQRLLLTGKTLADENPLSFYPGIKDGSKLNLLVIKKAEEGSSEARSLPQQKTGVHLLREEVSRVLRHYYTVSETESIVNELIKDLKNKVNNLSYDDLERLATALLQDQENVA
ncbi:PREDICTED: ubiquitin-like protein 4A [Wasmannia auropunctata]|uniref:ubiquitin-like protein 4A n=1 Tax=Wasmannia auropunctata TaxID=64793 RepID=UPI0005F01AFE|nr:PREDICTED: ubiquitin-like protein 4A [Wasmannia auropunctata]